MSSIIKKPCHALSAAVAVLMMLGWFLGSASAQNRWVMDENQFNQWIFNGNGGSIDEDSEITLMVEAIDRSCHLTVAQKEKIQLGGHGDYARFKEQIDDLRAEF